MTKMLGRTCSSALFAGAMVALGGCAAGGAGLTAGAVGTALALLLGLSGCSSSHGRGEGERTDSGMPDVDGGGVDEDRDGYEAGLDCNDRNAGVHPGAEELCDWDCDGPGMGGVDEDCDGAVDEDCPIVNCFPEDRDGDGWVFTEDCDDEDPTVHPGADEQCNWSCEEPGDGRDNDCDGDVDEGCAVTNCLTDADGDGYSVEGFGGPADCDDSNASVHPGAYEDCFDGIDNDCDGGIDDADPDGCVIINGMAEWEDDSSPA